MAASDTPDEVAGGQGAWAEYPPCDAIDCDKQAILVVVGSEPPRWLCADHYKPVSPAASSPSPVVPEGDPKP